MSHADGSRGGRSDGGGPAPDGSAAQGSAPCRVVVVDDHPLWREALSRDLDQAGFVVVGTAGSVAQALRVVAATRPDLVVLDLTLPDGSGVEVIRGLLGPGAAGGFGGAVLIVSASGEQADVLAAVQAGASGYVVKSARPEELVDAVRRTAAGAPVFSAGLAALVLGEMSRAARDVTATPSPPRLTAREIEVLRLVAKGLSARDAAARLGISHRTVQNHMYNVLGKLQLRNRVELTRFAVREGYDDAS
ncbi:two component transcriptional regulator, LuxR family [Frankia torreyi]|uniref:Two component transcriptional regulator, LuxR family n=1 Tax=Frankia torreyi TaxID=1856 RepID=A0A0D8B8U4_9ACTN|nr:response regulator transcription factor [Frankia torreyi]KJE20334.1 two component transcriptional regulator, LuxR family [Frankia torreyi]KQM02670.1 two component transcriptional regulator, LuxR family [Frankia sp. CpI1-P]